MERIFNSVPIGLYQTTLAGRFANANAHLAELLAYPSVDVLKKVSVKDLYVEAGDREKLLSGLDRHGATTSIEARVRRFDGSSIWVHITARRTDDAGEPLLTGAVTDVTARHQSEQALNESLALFRRMFDESPVAVAVLAMDGRFVRANARLCEMLGWSEEELKARTFLDVTHPDEHQSSRMAVDDLRAGRIDQIRIEKRYVRKDGKVVWADVSVRIVRRPNGDALCMMPVIIDTTERRSLEQQLRQAQKMEAVGELAGGIAHDFNNILTVILGYSELLLDDVTGNEALAANVRQIREGGQRAAALIRQLLAFSRTQTLRIEVADLSTTLDRFQQLVRPIIGEEIDLAFYLAPEPVLVQCDVAQFEQVAMNLIVNARDAMHAGGSISVRLATVTIEDDGGDNDGVIMPAGEYAQLLVQDTGSGMTEDTRRRIFEPFFTTKGPGKGTGLGLAVVYGIVQQLGGFIRVYSELGRGTTFRVYLPRAEQSPPMERPSRPETQRRAGGERILLVEDNVEARAFAALVLRKHGYDVREAATGAGALTEAARQTPDLLIADMVIAGTDGAEIARNVIHTSPRVKVLYTSGYMNRRLLTPSDVAIELLEKPYTATALLHHVRRCLDQPAPCPAELE